MRYPNPLMLLRIAQGDAFGVATEYIKFPRDQHVYDRALRFESYGKHPTHKLAPGQYTDDTQMSIAVAEVLLRDNPEIPTPERRDELRKRFTTSFFDCFKRDPREGYSRGFQTLLEEVQSADELLTRLKPDSDKNGAAMRSVPLGVLADPVHVKFVTNIQAKITHDTLGGVTSAMMVALMSHFALYVDEPLSRLPTWLAPHLGNPPSSYLTPWSGDPVTGPDVGMNTARAVLTLLMEEKSLLGIAKKTIEWGGDTDSVLAIAWGIASARMHDELPPFFDGGLENGTYGRTFLNDLGKKLMETYS